MCETVQPACDFRVQYKCAYNRQDDDTTLPQAIQHGDSGNTWTASCMHVHTIRPLIVQPSCQTAKQDCTSQQLGVDICAGTTWSKTHWVYACE